MCPGVALATKGSLLAFEYRQVWKCLDGPQVIQRQ